MSGPSPTGYEKTDVNVKKLVMVTVIPTILIIFCLIGLDQYMVLVNEQIQYDQVLNVKDKTYSDLVQKETQTLNNYQVIDKDKGIVAIPIQRAMQLTVQEGR